MPDLKPCPCGKTPTELHYDHVDGETCKWAWASGNCCNEWHIEFRTDYQPFGTDEFNRIAADAWNLSPRG